MEAFPVVGGSWPLTADLNVTTRGEAQSLHVAYAGGSQQGTSAYVWTKTMLLGSMTDGEPPLAVAFDEGTGAPRAPDVTQFPDNCPGNVHNSSYTYDIKSRRIGSEHDVTYNPDSCTWYSTSTRSAYDAEDHVVFDAIDVNAPGNTIRWNPLGHPISIGGPSPSNPPQTLHYDGDQLLFASDAHGALIVLNTETLGQVAPDNTVTVNDRDYSGMTVMQHSARGYTAWDGTVTVMRGKFPQQLGAYIYGSPIGVGTVGSGASANANFNYIHPDGFETVFGTVQGARVSHADGWTTPDAYAGDVHDPMSQKSFMWNRNNPYTYGDPSGYYWKSITGINMEALYLAFQSPDFVEAWNAIAESSRPFTLTGNNSDIFLKQPPGTIGVTNSQVGRDSDGNLGVIYSDAYIRPGMTNAQTASTIIHEVGSHQYFAIKDPNRELDGKFRSFREGRAYGRELMMDLQADILGAYEGLHPTKGSISPPAAGKS